MSVTQAPLPSTIIVGEPDLLVLVELGEGVEDEAAVGVLGGRDRRAHPLTFVVRMSHGCSHDGIATGYACPSDHVKLDPASHDGWKTTVLSSVISSIAARGPSFPIPLPLRPP